MKYLVVSDIHGCLPALEQVLNFFENGKYDQLVLLGDILNYGPRNGVPEGLDAMGIVARLNQMSDRIIAVRGNCDSEVDQMLLSFPCLADYAMLFVGGKKIFITHGHLFNPGVPAGGAFPPGSVSIPAAGTDVFMSGHTHLWELERHEGVVVCNTGSVTFPKDGRVPTFATIDDDMVLRLRALDGRVLKEITLG